MVARVAAALSPDITSALARLGAPIALLVELLDVHRAQWDEEDHVRDERAPAAEIVARKRAIDRLNARRHAIIDAVDGALTTAPPGPGARAYSETPGELCDRLFILDLKIAATARAAGDASLPHDARSLCVERGAGLRRWREHLVAHLSELLADVEAGRAALPPRCELKLYNHALLNPAVRRATRNAARGGIRHVLGIASTGHGASLAYAGGEGIVRATTLERWAREKRAILFARDEARDIVERVSPIDAAIHAGLAGASGKLPPFLIFEDAFPRWLAWFLRSLDLAPDDVDLVVTSNSHFATCDARLGGALGRFLPGARVITAVEHHAIHQRQAFWASGFDAAGVLTLDTCGEPLARLGGRKVCGTIAAMARDGSCRVLREHLFPEASAGLVYAIVTRHLGFADGEEGKTMGLAPYGDPGLHRRLAEHLRLHDDGSFALMSRERFEEELARHVAPRAHRRDAPIEAGHRDVAYAGQALIDAIVKNALTATMRLTGLANVAYAGGVALNSVANEAARAAARPRRLYVAPSAGDPGHALGCALLGAFEVAKLPPPSRELPEYLGPEHVEADFEAIARASGHRVARPRDVAETAARCLANGHVVARWGGRAEFGPRALGNRSIFADARRADMRDHLNARVKRREAFRPFAPIVLAEHASEWFELDGPSPYMLKVVAVRAHARAHVPAIVHVDGTARVQTVTREENAGCWEILRAFHALTGVPLLVNTSFNVDGEPIVESPEDAIRCFDAAPIDALLLGPCVLSKRPLDELAGAA